MTLRPAVDAAHTSNIHLCSNYYIIITLYPHRARVHHHGELLFLVVNRYPSQLRYDNYIERPVTSVLHHTVEARELCGGLAISLSALWGTCTIHGCQWPHCCASDGTYNNVCLCETLVSPDHYCSL